jgi:hypothetical protein
MDCFVLPRFACSPRNDGKVFLFFWIAAPQAARNDIGERIFFGLFCYCISRNIWIALSCFALLAMTEEGVF